MNNLSLLVEELPEIYQPIYGHPELSQKISRLSSDRLSVIIEAYDALEKLLGRSLKVLDLGCAQGFFDFSLAKRGARVHGVDFLAQNIEVCNAIAAQHPELLVSFETKRVEETISCLEIDQYDLVIGLSIFHHIVYEKGIAEVKSLLKRVSKFSGVLIIELALQNEPLYWGPSQPKKPRSLLDEIPFVHEVAYHNTHLSSIPRPMYIASHRYWILDGIAEVFESWNVEPHSLAQGYHGGSRRYFFGTKHVAKMYLFDHERSLQNKLEFERERQFLMHPPEKYPALACQVSCESETEGWIVVEKYSGSLLVDVLRENRSIDSALILRSLLDQLAILESAGLYHDDIRAWNIVIINDSNAAMLIDYGSIHSEPLNEGWPKNIFLAFFIFVQELVSGVVEHPNPLRTVAISPYNLPQPYQTWAMLLWKHSLEDWSFQLMLETLSLVLETGQHVGIQEPTEAWAQSIENAIQFQKLFTQDVEQRLEDVEQRLEDGKQRLESIEAAFQNEQNQRQRLEVSLQKSLHQNQKFEKALYALSSSRSMRVTAPLRIAINFARKIKCRLLT